MGENQKPAEIQQKDFRNISDGYQKALKVVDDLILKSYLSKLSDLEIIPLGDATLKSNIQKNVRFFKITEIVYEKDELATYKFASVINTLSMSENAVFILLDSNGEKTDFYMGVRSLDENRTTSSLKNIIENAMKGQFPGTKTADCTVEEMEGILDKIKTNSISAVSCVANNKTQNKNTNQSFVQGLEKFVLSMQGEKYTGIILANGTTQAQLRELRKCYETVYTQLSPFATTQINYTSNNSFNYSNSTTVGDSHTDTHTKNKSETTGTAKTIGVTDTHTESKESTISKTIKGMAAASSMLGAALAPVTGGTSLIVGGVVSGGLGMLGSAITRNVSDSTSTNESKTNSQSKTQGSSDGSSDTKSHTKSETEGHTEGTSKGMTLTLHDKSIEDTLQRLDKQLKRIDEFESLGMYECAAYFLSEDQYAAEVAASTYKALMRGENSGIEIAAINTWRQSQQPNTQLIGQYVKNFMHPRFYFSEDIEVTPCSLVSGNELAIHMGLPRKSVCGLPVVEHADFGKEIVTYDGVKKTPKINLGNIFNMGSACKNKVSLNIDSLTMHTFITGSTGSGKSNTVYEMVRQLSDNFGVNFLIIEPAKGEYKNIFGNQHDVHVLGTNPQYTDLLRINPFKFPKGIHILEHIDRLVEIFNVCWPMYAAMPAVLKDAILQAYQSCGWDLTESSNRYSDDLFPTFSDLLTELVDVIQHSAYSDEVKSNYMGSLVTRIKSLTNGLNGQIFTVNEIDNTQLFDKKVIVDISRIGSTETKSLIMGILIMRLNEHRMSTCEKMNSSLRHITVLEEAHNILKKTSTEQNNEEANVAGKSVEMISNAIAEMRTYGEGFIIADQSPNAVDISAIRNTNTKIIMRLPDEQDRILAGKSAGLKDNQLDEIAKLPKGVAVIYQNDWIEPVLCKISKFCGKEEQYKKDIKSVQTYADNTSKSLIQNLLNKLTGEPLDMNISELSKLIIEMSIKSKTKIKALHALKKNGMCNISDISSIIYEIICNPTVEKEAEAAESIEEWKNTFLYLSDFRLADLDVASQNTIIECILREQIERFNKPKEDLEIWNKYLRGEVI